jgi:hypothetical protein
MSVQNLEKMKAVWMQKNIPVIYRKGKGFPLFLKLPYKEDNRIWLKNKKRNDPKWIGDKKYWEIPKTWFDDTVNRSLERWGSLHIIQPHAAHEKCAPACWAATGHECQCSCLGENHGTENPQGRWFIVSDTFAVKYESKELACRLLHKKS